MQQPQLYKYDGCYYIVMLENGDQIFYLYETFAGRYALTKDEKEAAKFGTSAAARYNAGLYSDYKATVLPYPIANQNTDENG